MKSRRRRAQKPTHEQPKFTVAARMAAGTQRLRAGESVTPMTFALAYRARHAAPAR